MPDCASTPSQIVGYNLTTSVSADQSSSCSKLAGILGILTSLDVFRWSYQIEASSITIALDGYSALSRAHDND